MRCDEMSVSTSVRDLSGIGFPSAALMKAAGLQSGFDRIMTQRATERHNNPCPAQLEQEASKMRSHREAKRILPVTCLVREKQVANRTAGCGHLFHN
jgi:hypothetical protein